jgi:hypothetical protein
MIDKIKRKDDDLADGNDEGQGGSEGGSTGGHGQDFESWIPGFNDFMQAPEDQQNLREFYEQIALEQRLAAKSQGIDVQALNKKQQLKAHDSGNYNHNNPGNEPGSSGSGFDEHPELAIQDGMIDPSVVLPASEQEARNDPELKNRLKMGLSMQSLREELKNKQRYRNEPEQPRYRPRSAPKPRPY